MVKKPRRVYPQRGEIYLVNFDPTIGAEIKKTRPALIIQNNISNRYSPITIVAAITSKFSETLHPTEVMVQKASSGLVVDSVILLNQIRSVDSERLAKRIGRINQEIMIKVDTALRISLGLVEL